MHPIYRNHSRLKTPTLLQMETAECGAAALGIIFGYFGLYIPLEELRVACGISRDGSKAINMLKAARHYGFTAYGAEGDVDALSELKFPYIVFWKFDHFVVIEDIQQDKGLVYINDPATGRRAVSWDEFDKSYTGIILIFEPGPDFKQSGRPPTLIKSLKKKLLSSLSSINFLILISLALIVPGILIPGFSKIFIDDILLTGNKNWLVLLLMGLGLTAILRGLFSAIQQYYFLRLHLKLMITGTAEMFWHILRLPIAFFEQRYAGDISERLSANDRIASTLSNDVSSSVVNLFSMIFYVIIMFLYDYTLTIIGLITAVLNASILYWVSSRLQTTARKFLQDRGKLTGIEINGLRSIETLRSSVLDKFFFLRWSGNHAKLINTQQKMSLYYQTLSSLPGLLTGISTILILALGGYRIIEGVLSVGTLVAFQSLLMSFNEPLNNLLGIGAKLQEIPGDIARIEDVLHQTTDPRFSSANHFDRSLEFHNSADQASTLPNNQNPPLNSIEMRDVTFGYSPLDPPLIENFNLSLKVGGKVALVGPTGSGKSTLAKLVTGLYQPWSGSIKIEEKELQKLSPQSIANTLSFVDQDILLFEGTVKDNLTLWDPDVPLKDLLLATKEACIFEVLQNRPLFFDSILEEGGANFSGGERTRLEIARALVRNPKILILDEGTATLDSVTEQEVMKNLKARGLSLLLITHRLTTVQDADEIIVLEKGQIIERGTHESLMAQGGRYATLSNSG